MAGIAKVLDAVVAGKTGRDRNLEGLGAHLRVLRTDSGSHGDDTEAATS